MHISKIYFKEVEQLPQQPGAARSPEGRCPALCLFLWREKQRGRQLGGREGGG